MLMRSRLRDYYIITAILILGVFIAGSFKLFYDKKNDGYYATAVRDVDKMISDIKLDGNVLTFNSSASYYCLKSTKSDPKETSICFKKIEDNHVEEKLIVSKHYYLWIMDDKGDISKMITLKK